MRFYWLFVAFIVLSACGHEPTHTSANSRAPPIPVQTVGVAATEWPSTYEATGTVRAKTTAVISSKLRDTCLKSTLKLGTGFVKGNCWFWLTLAIWTPRKLGPRLLGTR